MKSVFNFNSLLVAGVTSVMLASCGGEDKKDQPVSTYDSTAVTVAPLCDSAWFPHSQTPAPLEGAGSPFDTSSTTNIIFHQWSWQKFLWLTQPMATGKTRFEEEYTQVGPDMSVVSAIDGVSLVLDGVNQAGTNAVLMSNASFNANSESDTIYYSIHINDTYKKTADSALLFISADTANLNNDITFPVGAVELKVSWVKASAIPEDEQANYYITEGYISSAKQKEKVALLGMHVVGVVKNHPEFIWATFEHNGMAPEYNWAATTDKDVPVTSDVNSLLFAKGDTAGGADLMWLGSSEGFYNVFTVYPLGVPRIAQDSFMVTSQAEPLNYNNVTGINECVAGELKDVWNNYKYNGSIWMNTDGLTAEQQADTLNSIGGNLGDASKGAIGRGSMAAFNITMETFVQLDTTAIHAMNVGGLTNCFSCHSSAPYQLKEGNTVYHNKKSPLYLSHLFRGAVHNAKGLSEDEVEALKTLDFNKMKLNKKN